MVLLALIDHDLDDVTTLGAVELRVGGNHAEIRVAVLKVEATDQFEIGGDALRIVNVGGLEPGEEIHLRRGHNALQAPGREGRIADEADFRNAGLVAFGDLEVDIDTAAGGRSGLRDDGRRATAGAAIDFLQPLHVGIDDRLAERPAIAGLDFGLQHIGAKLVIAFETNAIDDGILGDRDDERAAAAAYPHIREKAGPVRSLTPWSIFAWSSRSPGAT